MATVTVRPADRVLLVDGRPFFPIEAWQLPARGDLATVAAAGFNAVRWRPFGNGHRGPAAGGGGGTRAQAFEGGDSFGPDDAWELGLRVFVYLYDRCDLEPAENAGYAEDVRAVVGRMRDHPATLCYETVNEPAWRPDALSSVFHAAESLAQGRELVRSLDPSHPVFQGHSVSGTVDALRAYTAAADIMGCNPYPVFPEHMRRDRVGMFPSGRALDSPDQTIAAVADYTQKMVEVGRGTMPVWMMLQAGAWEDYRIRNDDGSLVPRDEAAVLFPSHAQMRFMAFADVIAGATGLLFNMADTPCDQPVCASPLRSACRRRFRADIAGGAGEDIAQLVQELRRLEAVLCGETVQLGLSTEYANLGFSIWKGCARAPRLLPHLLPHGQRRPDAQPWRLAECRRWRSERPRAGCSCSPATARPTRRGRAGPTCRPGRRRWRWSATAGAPAAPAAPAAGSLPPFPDSTCSSRSAAAGGRALAVEGGSAADDFGPYDVVVYEAVGAGAAAL